MWIGFGDFKLFSRSGGGAEADGIICTEQSVTGEETKDCVIGAEVAAKGSKCIITHC